MRRAGLPNDFGEAWRRTGKALYLTAADLNRGELLVFGHDEPYAGVPVASAIAASCAIPLWYKPMLVDNPLQGEAGEPDQLLLADGGLMRTANVRVAVEKGCELVICYNPFTRIRYDRAGRSLYAHGLPTLLSQATRSLLGARLDLAKELVYRDETIQADIVFIEPAEDDYVFFGMNPMSFWSKERASSHGYEAVRRSVDANHDLLSEVFRVHGIELRPARDPAPARPDHQKLQPDLRESRGTRSR
jgi:predicted acylesterase/phospholipase RssA